MVSPSRLWTPFRRCSGFNGLIFVADKAGKAKEAAEKSTEKLQEIASG